MSSSYHRPDLAAQGSNRGSPWESSPMRKKIPPPSTKKITLSQHFSSPPPSGCAQEAAGKKNKNRWLKLQRSGNRRCPRSPAPDTHINRKKTCPYSYIVCLGVFDVLRITEPLKMLQFRRRHRAALFAVQSPMVFVCGTALKRATS